MSRPTAAQKKVFQKKAHALRQHLLSGGPQNAVTLSRSYGLPIATVESIMKGMKNA